MTTTPAVVRGKHNAAKGGDVDREFFYISRKRAKATRSPTSRPKRAPRPIHNDATLVVRPYTICSNVQRAHLTRTPKPPRSAHRRHMKIVRMTAYSVSDQSASPASHPPPLLSEINCSNRVLCKKPMSFQLLRQSTDASDRERSMSEYQTNTTAAINARST